MCEKYRVAKGPIIGRERTTREKSRSRKDHKSPVHSVGFYVTSRLQMASKVFVQTFCLGIWIVIILSIFLICRGNNDAQKKAT